MASTEQLRSLYGTFIVWRTPRDKCPIAFIPRNPGTFDEDQIRHMLSALGQRAFATLRRPDGTSSPTVYAASDER